MPKKVTQPSAVFNVGDMELVSSECIILRNQDYLERDRLVTFLTRDAGKLRGIVKGSRKLTSRGVGSFEPFSRGLIHYVDKAGAGLVTIRKCDPQPPYLYLERDYHKFLYAGYVTELIDLCPIQRDESEPFFELLGGTLDALCEAGAPRRLPLLRLRFELRYLQLLGYQPDWTRCCMCLRPLLRWENNLAEPVLRGSHRFDPRRGGLCCPDCAQANRQLTPLAPESLAFLENWRNAPAGTVVRPTRQALEELEAAITQHLAYHLERQPRSLSLLPSLQALNGNDGA